MKRVSPAAAPIEAERAKEWMAVTLAFEIKEYPQAQVTSVRQMTSLAEIAEFHQKSYPRLEAHLRKHGASMTGAPFTLYHCESFDPARMDVEICIPTERALPEEEGILSRVVPAFKAFATTHVGSYDRLCETWEALETKMKEEGRVGGTPGIEVYLTDPEKLPVEEWRTEVALALR